MAIGIGAHFSTLWVRAVGNIAHDRVVDRIPNACKQHQQEHKNRRELEHIHIKIGYIGAHNRINHALAERAHRISHPFFFGYISFHQVASPLLFRNITGDFEHCIIVRETCIV